MIFKTRTMLFYFIPSTGIDCLNRWNNIACLWLYYYDITTFIIFYSVDNYIYDGIQIKQP